MGTDKMIDLNSSLMFSDRINTHIDSILESNNKKQNPRNYLGGSRLGEDCDRALQYEYFNTPKDPDKEFKGQILRIFKRGFWIEDAMVNWIQDAGFDLRTHDKNGEQFGFEIMNGKIKGHCDGVFISGHDIVKYPCLWENKGINQTGWKKLAKNGLKKAYPTYYGQIQIYQKYFELTENPALFSAVNMNTMEIYWESVPHDSQYAEMLTNKAERIILACDYGELLPRRFNSIDFYKCKWCSYQNRCWA